MIKSTALRRALHGLIQQRRYFPTVRALCSSTTASGSDAVRKQPADSPSAVDLDGGKTLARLSKMAQALQETITTEAEEQTQAPELLVDLENDVNTAFGIINSALDKCGRPCTAEELADRTHSDVLPIPIEALDYKDYLRAAELRDQIEEALIHLDVFPPREAFLEGEGLPFCRLERKALRKGQKEQQEKPEQEGSTFRDAQPDAAEENVVLTELRPVSEQELQRRKAFMEKSNSIEQVLKGFDTALLEVKRVHKVVKGGTTMKMRALVVIGNRNGIAGYGEGKSDTPQHAIERACRDAKRNLLHIDLHQDRTIYHRVQGKFVRARVVMWPSPKGSGISANNNFSSVFQLFGIKDVGAKQHGSRCLSNAIKALFNTLSRLETPESISRARGLQELAPPPPLPEHRLGKRFRVL